MIDLWVAAGVMVACILVLAGYGEFRKRRKKRRRSDRRRRNLAHARAWDLFMVRKRPQRLEYRPDEQ